MAGHSSLGDVFTKASDDAFVEYFLFPEAGIREDAEKLNEFLTDVTAETVQIIGEYLWTKDPFYVNLDTAQSHLHGTLQYDANVEDEWFTVYILQQLTLKFPGLVARVVDQDGEFLLIEAAEYLPDWAESDEVCQHRVYIFDGKIHLVGEVSVDGDVKASPTQGPIQIPVAIDLIRQYPDQTVASKKIQESIWNRVGKYPDKMFESFHHINLFLPAKVASILSSRPTFVSAAVRAFHYKDSIDMKSARLMPRFSPIEPLVKKRVRFTKTLYAMLSSQDYYPDSKVKWRFPMPSSSDYKAHALGAKLTLGFEILLSKLDAKSSSPSDITFPTSAWLRYEEKLKKYNYYKGLIEGSREYKELEEKARMYFQASIASDLNAGSDDATIRAIGAIMSSPANPEMLSSEVALPDDDDSWMDVNAEDLESLLEAQFKSKISDQKLDQIPEKLKEFMSQMSDFSGVEIPANGSDHGGSGDDEDEDGGLDPLDFRADDFVSAMDKLLLELGKPSHELDLSEPSSEEEEEGEQLKQIRKKLTFSQDSKIHQLMGEMDEELESTEVGKTFKFSSTGLPVGSTASKSQPSSSAKYEPVDIDMNALSSMLESFQSQEDPTGPSANLLRNVGFDISRAAKK